MPPRRDNAAPPPKRAALYVRVSTVYQIDKDSLIMQKKDLVAYADLVLGIKDHEIFEDAGFSGKNTVRPAYQDMMAKIHQGQFTHLLVWKIDRISRNLLDFATMYQELKELGVIFVSRNEQFDTSTAMGEAMLKIILVFAELERGMTSERVAATMIHRANSGLWNGGPPPFGYSADPDSKSLVINEAEAAVVRVVFEKYKELKALSAVAHYLNENGYTGRSGVPFAIAFVRRILRNPAYIGTYIYNKHASAGKDSSVIEAENHHAPIISRELFDEVQAQLDKNTNNPGRVRFNTPGNFAFNGVLFCGICGHRFFGSKHKRPRAKVYYVCPGVNASVCNAKQIQENYIGDFALSLAVNMLAAQKNISEILTPGSLKRHLLRGSAFSKVKGAGPGEFAAILAAMRASRGGDRPVFFERPESGRCAESSELDRLLEQKKRHEIALERLAHIYLYQEAGISDDEYTRQRAEILRDLDLLTEKIERASAAAKNTLADEDFVAMASAFILEKRLTDRVYVYYPKLAEDTAPEVLNAFFSTVYEKIIVTHKRIEAVVFRSGLALHFVYNSPPPET